MYGFEPVGPQLITPPASSPVPWADVAQALQETGDYLREHGWIKHSMTAPGGMACTYGAFLARKADAQSDGVTPLGEAVSALLVSQLPSGMFMVAPGFMQSWNLVMSYNDWHCTSFADVIDWIDRSRNVALELARAEETPEVKPDPDTTPVSVPDYIPGEFLGAVPLPELVAV